MGAVFNTHFIGLRHAALEGDLLEGVDLFQLFPHALDGGALAADVDVADLAVHAGLDCGVESAVACEDLCFCH